jgi:hypothetical protein
MRIAIPKKVKKCVGCPLRWTHKTAYSEVVLGGCVGTGFCPGPGVYRLVRDDPKARARRNAKARRVRKKDSETEDWGEESYEHS